MSHLIRHTAAALLLASPLLASADEPPAGAKLAGQFACTACHGSDKAVVGPAFRDIAKKYKGQAGAEATLIAKVKAGGSGTWGPIPMPPQAHVSEADMKTLVAWVLAGSPEK